MPHASTGNSYDPFRIDSIQEIDQILLQILEQGVLLRMHAGNSNQAVITTLVHIDFDTETLMIDSAAQPAINQQLIEKGQAFFQATLNQVAIEFSVQPISATSHDGLPALMGPIPAFLRRLQRRDSFRVQPSLNSPATCTLNTKTSSLTLPIFDISAGGISFLDEDSVLNASKGHIYSDSKLQLPGVGVVTVDLQVVRQQPHVLASGKKMDRYGCAFFQLNPAEQIRIQNYINQEERLQIARERGLA